MSNAVFRSRSLQCLPWHLASSFILLPVDITSLSRRQTDRALTLEHALPIQAAAAVFQHTHTHTHIGSSETAGLRRWRLPGGKSSLARQAHASALTFINFDFNLRSCQVHTVLTHSHQRLTACCQQRLHVTLSHPRQLSSFTRSQASSFPLRRFKTTTDHVPASHSIRHSLRRFTPVLHFRALLRLGLSVA
jgi:hypothetical protein